jgi:hypothetical protein
VTGDDGEYAWHLRNPRRVEPIEVRGSASLYHVPDERIRIVASKAVRVPAPKAVRVPPRKRARAAQRPPLALTGPKRPPPPKCPACGAGKPTPIVYGYPSPDLWAEKERGDAELGGCVVSGGEPTWRCRACAVAFGSLEI